MKNENKKSYRITIIVVAMFVLGLIIGILVSNIRFNFKGSDSKISEERAKEIALKDARGDFTKDVSLDTDIFLEYDSKEKVYEVSFYLGGTHYEYEIRATDGVVIDKDIDIPMNQ